MAIIFRCTCGQNVSAPDEYASKAGRCPGCRGVIRIPAAPAPCLRSVSFAPAPPDRAVVSTVRRVAPQQSFVFAPVPQGPAVAQLPVPFGPTAARFPQAPPPLPGRAGLAPTPAAGLRVVLPLTAKVVWPGRCVGCFAMTPQEKLTVNVLQCEAGKSSGGQIIGVIAGGLLGGLVGAIVGGAIGGAASGGGATRIDWEVPICRACRARIHPDQIRWLGGEATADVPETTLFFDSHVRKDCVVVTFQNAQYGSAFRWANRSHSFDCVQAFRSGDQTAAPIDATSLLPAEVRGLPLDQSIVQLLAMYLPQSDLFVTPNIPPKKLANAVRTCRVPFTQRILGLMDCTVFGSGKNCLLFGCDGVYYHNDWSGKSSGCGMIPYAQFPARRFGDGGPHEVSLGRKQYVNIAGCSVSKDTVVELLDTISGCVSSLGYVGRAQGALPSAGSLG